ncbi:MAG TPA: hypothetical protein VHV47_06710 [Opitutaceae bacterium]|jgi:hypothetical protein|nr:hypothetical protein [Opitutaceae bacterium]
MNRRKFLGAALAHFMGRGRPTAEKYFWKNSLACYKWVKRNSRQPS